MQYGIAFTPLVPSPVLWLAAAAIVMYTLTGNYKADQVHAPALIERLGQ